MATQALFEYCSAGSSLNVNREGGYVDDVKILGRFSKNKREYTETACNQASRLYEGLNVYPNHPPDKTPKKVRDVEEVFGWISNTRVLYEGKDTDGVYGRVNFFPNHGWASTFCDIAELNPRSIGLSHNADGVVKKKNGKVLVESILGAQSVDIVTRPATTKSLFESETMAINMTLGSFSAAYQNKTSPVASKISSLIEQQPALKEIQVSVEDVSSESSLKSAFVQLLESEDFAIDSLLETKKSALPPAVAEPPNASPVAPAVPAAEGIMESVAEMVTKVTERLDAIDKKQMVDGCLASFGLHRSKVDAEKLTVLEHQTDEAGVMTVIESWPITERQPVLEKKPVSTFFEREDTNYASKGTYEDLRAKVFTKTA